MDPASFHWTELAPAGVYLAGLVVALRHIAKLYDDRQTRTDKAHDEQIELIQAGHEARLKTVEMENEECRSDRKVLREELRVLRDRVFTLSVNAAAQGTLESDQLPSLPEGASGSGQPRSPERG